MEEQGRQGWFRRMGKRVLAGTLIGAAVGTALGVLAGLLIFQPGSRAVWGTTVAGLVFGGAVRARALGHVRPRVSTARAGA